MENDNEIIKNTKRTNKFFKNNIFEKLRNLIEMIISYFEINFSIYLKPSDLLIKYEKKMKDNKNYFEIYNISFNSDIEKLLSKDMNSKESQKLKQLIEKIINTNNEINFNFDLKCRLCKNQIFNFKEFNFKKLINNELQNYEIPNYKNNILIYVLKNNDYAHLIKNNLDYLINEENEFKIDKIYIIKCLSENNNKNYEEVNFNNIKNNNNLIEILFLKENENLSNIILDNKNISGKKLNNYFFICDNNKKILKINNDICDNEKLKLKLKKISKKNTNKNEIEELNFILNTLIPKNRNNFYYYTNFDFSGNFIYHFNDENLLNLNLYKINNLVINGELRTNHYNLIKNKISNLNFKPNNLKFNLNEIETFTLSDIDFTKQKYCDNCNNNINIKNPENNGVNKIGFYYCYWCKVFYCTNCIEEKLSINCSSDYKQKLIDKKHNLLYFCTTDKEDLKEFDKLKLGKNNYNEESLNRLNSYNENHSYICNGCRRDSRNQKIKARYVCVSCRPGIYRDQGYVDYCFNCIEHLRNGDNFATEIENIEDDYYPKNHSHRHHVYLCVVFQIDNYQNY